jgi:hypothetical protein
MTRYSAHITPTGPIRYRQVRVTVTSLTQLASWLSRAAFEGTTADRADVAASSIRRGSLPTTASWKRSPGA